MVSLYKEWPLEIQMSRLQIRLRVKQMTSRFLIFSSDIYDVLIQIESSEVVRIMRIHCRVVPVFSPFFLFLYSKIMHLFLCQRVFISSSFGIASRSVYDVIHGANPDFWISLSLDDICRRFFDPLQNEDESKTHCLSSSGHNALKLRAFPIFIFSAVCSHEFLKRLIC